MSTAHVLLGLLAGGARHKRTLREGARCAARGRRDGRPPVPDPAALGTHRPDPRAHQDQARPGGVGARVAGYADREIALRDGEVDALGLVVASAQGGYSLGGGYWIPAITRTVPVPWGHLALVVSGALALLLAMVGLSLLFLRSSTEITELRTA